MLAATNFDCRLCFSRTNRRNKLDFVALKKIHLLGLVFREKVMEQLFAFRAKCRKVGKILIPHRYGVLRYSRKPSDASRLLNRIN
jgi:hypothetical protein